MAAQNARIGVAHAAVYPSVKIGLNAGLETSFIEQVAKAASKSGGWVRTFNGRFLMQDSVRLKQTPRGLFMIKRLHNIAPLCWRLCVVEDRRHRRAGKAVGRTGADGDPPSVRSNWRRNAMRPDWWLT